MSRTSEARQRQEPYQVEGTPAPLRWLPPGYFLDRSDPKLLILRRPDGSFVAAFSARGATREGIRQAAEDDAGDRLHTSTHSHPSATAAG